MRDRIFDVAEGEYDQQWHDMHSGRWEPATFEILDYFVGNGDIVMDLGAWIGPVSLFAATLGSEVYAIEPDPQAFAELEKNVLQNPALRPKINGRNLAITNKDAEFTLYARKNYGHSSSSLLPRTRDGLSDIRVEGITLKAFIEKENIKKIHFIKMDIEGGEFDLLPSISTELNKMGFPTLFISFHYSSLTEHQYYLNIKSKLISRILMKLENLTGLELFGKTNRRIVLKALQSLLDFKFIYTESGQELSHAFLQKNPSLVKKHNLVFTNKKWD